MTSDPPPPPANPRSSCGNPVPQLLGVGVDVRKGVLPACQRACDPKQGGGPQSPNPVPAHHSPICPTGVLQRQRGQETTPSPLVTHLSAPPSWTLGLGRAAQLPPSNCFSKHHLQRSDRCLATESLRDCGHPCLPLASHRYRHPGSRERPE